jgi:large subunit ribosomal protein L9
MKIVLTQEVRSLGAPGDVVEVADGYARNFLLPRGLAMKATRGTLDQVAVIRRTREMAEVRDREQAERIAGDGGRLFGQVTPAQVVDAIARAGGPKVDRRRLQVDAPIKNLGVHRVHLRLHPDVEAEVNIDVIKA